MEKLEIKNVSKSFDGKPIIENISVTVGQGEIVSLLGVSGGGKTTLFNIISGLLQPDCGKIILDGKEITGQTGKISYMMQKDLLLPFRTIEDNIALPLMMKGESKKKAREQISSLFGEFGLDGTQKKYPSQLSGGMKQRAALLRTYMFSHDVALLDEPFSALDENMKNRIIPRVFDLLKNKTVLIISHDQDEASKYADKIINI